MKKCLIRHFNNLKTLSLHLEPHKHTIHHTNSFPFISFNKSKERLKKII
jgi:hypothetical protein